MTGKYHVGETVTHRGHKCEVIDLWTDDEGRPGVTIQPVEGYGFPVDVYEDEV